MPHPIRTLAVSVAAVLAVTVTLVAQQPVVSFDRAQELTKTYPFTKFSKLASFDVPYLPDVFSHGVRPQLPKQALVIPPEVSALNGATIAVRGFMLPVDATPAGVGKFILTATVDSCHWGMIGMANESMMVEMAGGKRIPYYRFQPIVMFGRLSIDPKWRGDGLAGLDQMKADYVLAEGP